MHTAGTWTPEQARQAGAKGREARKRRSELDALVRRAAQDIASDFTKTVSTHLRSSYLATLQAYDREIARSNLNTRKLEELSKVIERLRPMALDEPGQVSTRGRKATPAAAPPPITIPTPAPHPGPSPTTPSTPTPIESAPID